MTDTGSISDGYHTFDELYEYRLLYHAHAVRAWMSAGYPVVRSWRHHDGEECFGGGWFIVTAQLPTGQVSNHYPASDWDLFAPVPEVDTAPEWDGHTPADAVDRLRAALTDHVVPRARDERTFQVLGATVHQLADEHRRHRELRQAILDLVARARQDGTRSVVPADLEDLLTPTEES